MKLKRFDTIFYLLGVAIMLNSISMVMLLHKAFNDSTVSNREPITRLLTPPSLEIK